jgi:hypothetical protein
MACLLCCGGDVGAAEAFPITGATRDASGTVTVRHSSRVDAYYLLEFGGALPLSASVVDARLGADGAGSLVHPQAPPGTGFYRVLEIPRDGPRDTDRDGLDDVFELERPGALNPLDPRDAGQAAPGAGGKTWLEVYAPSRTPLTTVADTSPYHNEDGVAVTRETVFRLTMPLAPGSLLSVTNLYASFAGRRVLGRVQVSADRRSVTFFPGENLPASARVRVTFDPGEVRDELGRRLDLAGNGQAGSAAFVDFDTLSIVPVGVTAVVGRVYASEPVPDGAGGFRNQPLSGVTITVDGAEETLRTTTDATGFFRLQPAPAGRFFVHVDGRTATESSWPNGAYYPYVGKSWEAVAGATTNLANGTGILYLPKVPADALQPVSTTEETVIAFPPSVLAANPALAGVEIRVPPNALFGNSGQRGGRVGLAPVASDRLPEPLPPGIEHVLDITVQSDGAENFDEPVPVRFPNLPSPATGQRVPPGGQTALVSFNHDLGRWEVVGSMTATADGQFLESDPGVGVRQPGWHGWQQLTWIQAIPPVTWPTVNPWIVAIPPPNPPGPLPPPRPPPPSPEPPEPWPPIPPPSPGPAWPTTWPEPWPPVPPWPNGNSEGGGPDPGPVPPLDGPDDLPGDGGPGAGDHQPQGVSAGPYCLTPAIEDGCTNSPVPVPAAPSVPIRPQGGAFFDLRYSELAGTVTAEVRSRSSGQLVFATQVNPIRPPGSVGFGPAEQAFVHWFRQTTPNGLSGDEVVQLVSLRENAQTYAPSKTIVLGASYLNASSVSFSPHGRYLVYTALKTDAKIALLVVDVVSRETVFQGSFPYSTAPVLVQPGDMAEFGPDCADRTLVFRFGDTPTTLAWHLINLQTRQVVASRRIQPGGGSAWEFSSCGDVVQLRASPTGAFEFIATLDGRPRDGLEIPGAPPGQGPALAARRHAPPGAGDAGESAPTLAPRPVYSRGVHHWLLLDLLNGQVVQRGRSGGSGALLDGVLVAPRRPFRLFVLRADDFRVGTGDFVSPGVGQGVTPPYVLLGEDTSGDTDGDGLRDFAEFIAGARADRRDSNGDGQNDAAAVRAGLDPLAGGALATGIVGALPLPGSVVDVCADGDRVLLALGGAGIAVVQHPPGRNPVVIARVDTPGDARRVACSGTSLAVADGPAGVVMVDLADPPAARIKTYLPSVGEANAVTAAAGLAFVGTQSGQVVIVDLATGTELGRIGVGGAVQDLQFGADRLYVLSNRRLLPFRWSAGDLVSAGPGVTSGSGQAAHRLFVGGGFAYVTHTDGYRVFDLADPDAPVERTSASDTQIGWSQLVANGSGLGLAAAGPQANNNSQVQVYNLSDPARNDQFLTRHPMPASTVAVASHQGIAYVGATTAGLQVLNYLPQDTGTNPPTIRLVTTFPTNPARLEAGGFEVVGAEVTDDVQVREVEFHLDGERVASDGSYPFQYAFFAPARTAERTALRLRAKAIDTAGNFAWSDEIEASLQPDLTPPRAHPAAPAANGFAASPTRILVVFNEPIDPDTLTAERLSLRYLGPDRATGTDDDARVAGEVGYLSETRVGELRFAAPTVAGRYEAVLAGGVADTSGNAISTNLVWAFEVVVGTDRDGDGLTDEFELAGGLDPGRADENGNGVPDSLDDFDGDGLSTGQEMVLGTLPRNPRTFENTPDAQLDRDKDFLTDIRELSLGTDWTRWDTDGDGWNDESEITTGDHPLRPNGYLRGIRIAAQTAQVLGVSGPQFASALADVLRTGEGLAMYASATTDVLRQGGPNENGHSIVSAEPPVRVRIFDPEDPGLPPEELPREGAFVIEAEDYDFEGGRHLPVASVMPYYGGAYSNRVGVLDIDYFNQDGADSQAYRPLPAPNNASLFDNIAGRYGAARPGWSVERNWRLGSAAPGDWQQYTRTVPAGTYWVWAALSHAGREPGQLRGSLERVTGDPTQPGAATVVLGEFDAPGSGGWGENALVPLRVGGTLATVTVVEGTGTFRFRLASGDLDWFVLIPLDSAP